MTTPERITRPNHESPSPTHESDRLRLAGRALVVGAIVAWPVVVAMWNGLAKRNNEDEVNVAAVDAVASILAAMVVVGTSLVRWTSRRFDEGRRDAPSAVSTNALPRANLLTAYIVGGSCGVPGLFFVNSVGLSFTSTRFFESLSIKTLVGALSYGALAAIGVILGTRPEGDRVIVRKVVIARVSAFLLVYAIGIAYIGIHI